MGEGGVTTSMNTVVTSLTTNLASEDLWGVVGDIVPFLTIGVLFALGLYFVRKAIKGVSKGKARI